MLLSMIKKSAVISEQRATEAATYCLYFFTALTLLTLYRQLAYESSVASLADMIQGRALAPFQHRMLIPWLVGAINGILPQLEIHWIALEIRLVVVFLLLMALRHWLRLFFSETVARLAPLAIAMMLPWSFDNAYADDFPSILVYTVCLILLWKQAWLAYLALFVLGTFNRETTILLILPFVATMWGRLGQRRFWSVLALQVLLFALAKALLLVIYPITSPVAVTASLNGSWERTMGSVLAVIRPEENLERIARVFPRIFDQYVREFWNMSGYLWILALIGFPRAHPFLKRVALVVPVLIVAMFVVGLTNETRIFYELVPIYLVLALYAIVPAEARSCSADSVKMVDALH